MRYCEEMLERYDDRQRPDASLSKPSDVWSYVEFGSVFHGHGLQGYRAHVVENSPWIAVERATNSVHRGFREERWKRLNHLLLSFHDDTFECFAEGWTTELVAGTFRQVVELAVTVRPPRSQKFTGLTWPPSYTEPGSFFGEYSNASKSNQHSRRASSSTSRRK